MGNKIAKEKSARKELNTFSKMVLQKQCGGIWYADIFHLKSSDSILMATVHNKPHLGGMIMISEIKDKKIKNYASKTKPKTSTIESIIKYNISCEHRRNMMRCSITYNQIIQSALIAYGGMDGRCTIYNVNSPNDCVTLNISDHNIQYIQFIENTNILLCRDAEKCYIFDYIQQINIITLEINPFITCMNISFNDKFNTLIIGIGCYCKSLMLIYTLNVKFDDKNQIKMEIINCQQIAVYECIECISFSPNNGRFICMGHKNGNYTVLIKHAFKKYEYDILFEHNIIEELGLTDNADIDEKKIRSCCWLNSNIFIISCGLFNDKIIAKKLNLYNNDKYIEIINEFFDGVESISIIICNFCGYTTETYDIFTTYDELAISRKLVSLPTYQHSPGIFIVTSFDTEPTLYIPLKNWT